MIKIVSVRLAGQQVAVNLVIRVSKQTGFHTQSCTDIDCHTEFVFVHDREAADGCWGILQVKSRRHGTSSTRRFGEQPAVTRCSGCAILTAGDERQQQTRTAFVGPHPPLEKTVVLIEYHFSDPSESGSVFSGSGQRDSTRCAPHAIA
jgi:hypothetical protein